MIVVMDFIIRRVELSIIIMVRFFVMLMMMNMNGLRRLVVKDATRILSTRKIIRLFLLQLTFRNFK